MYTKDERIQATEQAIANKRKVIERRNDVLKLQTNPEFRRIINEQFLLSEAAAYIEMAGDPALQENERADALALALATGHLKRYLSVIVRMGNVAEENLADHVGELEALRAADPADFEEYQGE